MIKCLLISMLLVTGSAHAADEDIDTARSAAEQGDAEAQFNLGYMYDMGTGVPEFDAEAVQWYRKSAEQGFVAAEFHLGLMYVKGEGVPENHVEAVLWLQRSAEQGHSEGQHLLGLMYAKGKGVPKDPKVAYAWISIAAARGVKLAKKDKETVSGGMTREEIAEAQELSLILWEAYGPDRNLSSMKKLELKLKARQAIAKLEEERKRQEVEQKLKEQLEARLAAETEKAAANALSAAAGRIRASIEANWRRPGASLRGLKVVIELRVGRNGEVQSARVVESSGDTRFDESAELAVREASPLPIPREPEYYDHIKEFRIEFNPDE